MSERKVGLDILKIFAMIMVLSLHILGQGGFLSSNNSNLIAPALLLETFCIVAVNCYVLITGYFQVDLKFKFSKILKLWVKIFFYSSAIYLILLFLNKTQFSLVECLESFFPFFTKRYWFINSYILLYILSPFINKFIRVLEKKEYEMLLLILFIFFSVFSSFLPGNFSFDSTGGYGIIWFIVLYLFGAYIKLYWKDNYNNNKNLYIYLLITIGSFLVSLFIKYLSAKFNFYDFSTSLFGYNTFTVFLASIFLFLYFKNINIKSTKIKIWAGKIVPLTLGVYVIHEQSVLRKILYFDILNLDIWWNDIYQMIVIPIFIILVFFICILIEKITINTFQKWIFNILEKIYLKMPLKNKDIA